MLLQVIVLLADPPSKMIDNYRKTDHRLVGVGLLSSGMMHKNRTQVFLFGTLSSKMTNDYKH